LFSQLTVFRLNDSSVDDLDHAILTALLNGRNLTIDDKLSLVLAWDRVDLAQEEVIESGQVYIPA
jgi:hypothetical protein